MPLLGSLLVSLFGGFATWLAGWMTKKLAIALAAVATLATIIGALLLAMRTALQTVASTLPSDGFIMMGLGMVFPPIASVCVTTIATVWSACVLYAWQRDALDLYVKG